VIPFAGATLAAERVGFFGATDLTAAFLAGLALGLTSVFSKLLKSIGVSSSDRFLAAGFLTGFAALIGFAELEAGLALTDLEGFVALMPQSMKLSEQICKIILQNLSLRSIMAL